MNARFNSDLKFALKQIPRARRNGWRGFQGESLEPKLARLEVILQSALESSNLISATALAELKGLPRWVADWIPDLDHPLLDALYRVAQHADELGAK